MDVSYGPCEPPDAQRLYTERLVWLPGWFHFDGMFRPVDLRAAPAPGPAFLSGLGLPRECWMKGSRLYVVPKALHKLHPKFDGALEALLDGDPRGCIVLHAPHGE